MMEEMIFPKGLGLDFLTDISEEESGKISIKEFALTLNGKKYIIPAAEFSMEDGETVYITPSGMKKCSEKEYPEEKFENGAAYWAVQRLGKRYIKLEVR